MMLRSSSTPVLGSLLSSFSESPCNSMHFESNHHVVKHLSPLPTTSVNHKLCFHQTLTSFSSSSSPISPSIASDLDRHRGFRRAQSEGNLEDLAYASSSNKSLFTLDTIPSFSFSSFNGLREEEEDEEKSEFEEEEEEEWEEENGISSIMEGVKNLTVTEEVGRVEHIGTCSVGFENMSVKETLPAVWFGTEGCGDGIGGCRGGSGGGGDYNSMGSCGHDGESRDEVEEYYKKMVDENPGNPLFLSNYAQFLYEYKRDRDGAEEYYSRAILADPKDGEVLSRYGKLVWELHHDQDRASTYFERAVQASPQDSHVHAAYASFLWDTEEDDNGCSTPQPPHFHEGAMLVSAGAY